MNIDRFAIPTLALLTLGGCATYGNSDGPYDPAAFGEANRQSYAAMIVNPEPEYTEEMATSGEHAADAIERYREDQVKQPESIRSTERLDRGGGGPGS